MSLATRCPACGTVFRVVQDQLKVSGGWVRCGQCHEVFNGLQTLFELPADPPVAEPSPPAPVQAPGPTAGLFVTREASPPPHNTWEAAEPVAMDGWPAVDEPTVDLADQPMAPPSLIDTEAPPAPERRVGIWAYTPRLADDDDASEAETVMPEDVSEEDIPGDVFDADLDPPPDLGETPATDADASLPLVAEATVATPAQSFVVSQPPSLPVNWPSGATSSPGASTAALLAADQGSVDSPEDPQRHQEPAAVAAPTPEAEAAATWPPQRRRKKRQRKPAFMREAERAARWRSPGVRAVLGGASTVLGLMLVLQITHHLRDDLAARWPPSRSALATWCQFASCQLRAPRALASITLDSSALSRTMQTQVLRFEAELRNSASHAVMAPALDVSFTDNLGHPLVRKVLLPEQLGASSEGLAPNQTWRIEVPLQVGDLPISGFTAEVFYP